MSLNNVDIENPKDVSVVKSEFHSKRLYSSVHQIIFNVEPVNFNSSHMIVN